METKTITLREAVESLLAEEENQEDVRVYALYCQKLLTDKKRDGSKKNPWMANMHPERLAGEFRNISSQGLVFDGKHITWQSTGVSFDYVAYKNKMLVVYPESKFDVSVVNEADTFTVKKESGKVIYNHELGDIFSSEEKDIVGAYCVIKNERGEFITVLNKTEIQKHRKVAKTDYIWRAWFKEMVLKTVIKKAVKYHFDDIYTGIETLDNEQYDLEKVADDGMGKHEEALSKITNKEELLKYYKANEGDGKEFAKLVTARKKELE